MLEGNWFAEFEVKNMAPEYLFCTAGKNPGVKKIERYCKQANKKNGCKNLAPWEIIEAKPGEFSVG
ncbi:hypothetical protein M1403_04070 [Patescibacteria group bacterium]|nr:hypothetical protein [Patescibacteria group bacterium]